MFQIEVQTAIRSGNMAIMIRVELCEQLSCEECFFRNLRNIPDDRQLMGKVCSCLGYSGAHELRHRGLGDMGKPRHDIGPYRPMNI